GIDVGVGQVERLTIERHGGCSEIFFGELEGAIWTELVGEHKERLKNFKGFQAPGGESLKEMEHRVLEFVEGLGSGRHLVFTHGGVVRQLLHGIGHTQFVKNCTVVGLNWTLNQLEFIREPTPQ
ncbi:MAG: histidine phosphatase family protein, partial [Myxococcota bacterium]